MSFISQPRLSISLLALVLMLTACSTTPPTPMAVDSTMIDAKNSTYPMEEEHLLLAAGTHLNSGNTDKARSLLNQIEPEHLSRDDRSHYILLEADFATLTHDRQSALKWLSTISLSTLKPTQQIKYHQVQSNVYALEGKYSQAIEQLKGVLPDLSKEDYPELYSMLWQNLLLLDESQLLNLLSITPPDQFKPWIELAIIYRTPDEFEHQLSELKHWQQRWQTSDALHYLPQSIVDLQQSKPYQPASIALLLPLTGPLAQTGAAVREGIMAAYYEAMEKKLYVPEIQLYDSANRDAAELALDAQAKGAELIIGPLGRNAVEKAVSDSKITIPQLTLNHASSTTMTANPTYQMGLSSKEEAKQSAQRAWKDGFRNTIMLIPDSKWGQRVAAAFSQEWQLLGGNLLSTVHYTGKGDFNQVASTLLLIDESQRRANSLQRVLGKKLDHTPRRRQDADMIFMVATATHGRQLKPALDFYFAYDLPVYTTSGIYSGQQDPSKDRDLSDIRFPIMPWHVRKSSLKTAITQEWPSNTGKYESLYALGADAWRLYPRMEHMSHSLDAKMFGATGTLSINENGNVERQLIWQYFSKGRPTPLTHEHSARKTHAMHVLDSQDKKHAR